jgi:hypothetical protein
VNHPADVNREHPGAAADSERPRGT